MAFDSLPPKLSEVVRKAEQLVGPCNSMFDGANVYSFEEILRSAGMIDESKEKRIKINLLLSELKSFYQTVPISRREADSQVIIADSRANAYISLIPPRGGKVPSMEEIIGMLEKKGIKFGVNLLALESAYNKLTLKGETVLSLQIAQSKLPVKGQDGDIKFLIKLFDKTRLFDPGTVFDQDITNYIEVFQQGKLVAAIQHAQYGEAGVDLRGHEIAHSQGKEIGLSLGAGLRVAQNGKDVYATTDGYLVLHDNTIDAVPLYVVSGNLPEDRDIQFNGDVLVTGNVQGPVTIDAEDVYILGNVESATIQAHGYVFVNGGIIGKRETSIETEGSLFSRFISDAKVIALGDVVVRNAITYSDVTSNSRIIVKAERGALVGGQLAALKEIVAKSIGSDFGTFTSTCVGKDFLTKERLAVIENKIARYETDLKKIADLKGGLSERRIDISQLPPEKQDVYIAILQKEKDMQYELNSLNRRKEKFSKAMQNFLEASVKVMESLHPPAKVQICEVVEEISEKMDQVLLILNPQDRTKIFARKLE